MNDKQEKAKRKSLFLRMAKRIKSGWNRYAMARDADGNVVHVSSGKAVSWCLSGAFTAEVNLVRKESECHLYAQWWDEVHREVLNRHHVSPSRWNDDPKRTKGDVVKLLHDLAHAA